jgi:predicted DNA-binding protein (MmcQ/YjbR family)
LTPAQFDKACLDLPGASMDVQWGDDHVYKVGGKMFAVTGGAGGSFSFKASDIAFEALTQSGRGKPAPYLARARWVWFEDLAGMNAAEVTDWLTTAHGLVAAKLTRKQRAELGL